MKVLLSGSSGLLGASIKRKCQENGWQCDAFLRENFSWKDIDYNVRLIKGYDVFIHAAANTDVEFCEINNEECYRDNFLLTERLSFSAEKAKTKFVYISSTGVYGSSNIMTPYCEYDTPQPTTHHHKAKLLAEHAVKDISSDYLILRTGWIFGGSPENKKNFVARRVEEALRSKEVIFANDQQIGNPTYNEDFSEALMLLLKEKQNGLFNCVNDNSVSRFEYVKTIIETASLSIKVEPIETSYFNRRAKASNNESAINLKLSQLNLFTMKNWRDSLQIYMKHELNEWISQIKKRHNEQS